MRIRFLGAPLDLLTLAEVRALAVETVKTRGCLIHSSLNALKIVEAHRSDAMRSLLERFDLVTADGMSVVWGLALLGHARPERVAGVDLMGALLEEGARRAWRFYLLGATREVSSALRQKIEALYPGARVAGRHHGYFAREEEGKVVQAIADSGADVLFVGMPSPRKEEFLLKNRGAMKVPFSMGVGGGLDLLAGRTLRAPIWMRSLGMEWAYRVFQEPRRLARRYAVSNLSFAAMLLREMTHSGPGEEGTGPGFSPGASIGKRVASVAGLDKPSDLGK
jgi:N-acetylglucosaminyldiphosphoundecaprenol N-acetyl-beta-D-mannosaminyltransferase